MKFSAGERVWLLPELDNDAAALSTLEVSEGSDDCFDNGWQSFEVLAFADEAACLDYFDDL